MSEKIDQASFRFFDLVDFFFKLSLGCFELGNKGFYGV
jgi:hypothetical protein